MYYYYNDINFSNIIIDVDYYMIIYVIVLLLLLDSSFKYISAINLYAYFCYWIYIYKYTI